VPKDLAGSNPRTVRAIVGVAVLWLPFATALSAQQPAPPSPVPPVITVRLQEPQPPAQTSIWFWLVVAGIGGLSVWGFSHFRRAWPRRGLTHVLFEDLTADRDQRLHRNRVLAQSVVSRLQDAQPLAFDLQMDVMPGTNEPGFGGLQPVLTMTSVLDYERADRPITIGAIEFPLRDLLRMISLVFARPPEQYLEGWLIEANGSVEVGAQLLDHRRHARFKPNHERKSGGPAEADRPLAWIVRGTGRERAIMDLAAQILVGTGRSTLTSDWRSLRSFHEAMLLRDDQQFDAHQDSPAAGDPDATISAARSHLARSVSYDPSNWIARFSLAVTLCRDNEPLLALEHLATLEKAVARAWACLQEPPPEKTTANTAEAIDTPDAFDGPGFKALMHHLKKLPECAFLILFNQGVALATLKEDAESLRRARGVFKQLADWMPPGVGCTTFARPYDSIAKCVKHQPRATLALYAMGAHASLIADNDGHPPAPRLENDPVSTLQELLERIDADCRVQKSAHWPSAMAARAITQAALGQVFFNRRCLRDAQTNFEASLAAEPRLVRALLGLAEIYLERADEESHVPVCDRERVSEWLLRADALLGRATAINAGCAQAKRLRDRLRTSQRFIGAPSVGIAS
jgi:hypothetical protein